MVHIFYITQNLYETTRVRFPEMVMFMKLLLNPSLNSLPLVSITPGEVDPFIPKI